MIGLVNIVETGILVPILVLDDFIKENEMTTFNVSDSTAILVKDNGVQVAVDALLAAGVEFEVITQENRWKLEDYNYYFESYSDSGCEY